MFASHVSDLVAEGIIAPVIAGWGRRKSVFDVLTAVPAAVTYERRRRASGTSARDRRDESLAKLNELRLQREQGKLVPREEVMRAGQTVVLAAKAKLLSLPWRLISGAGVPPSAEPAMRGVVHEALSELVALRDLTTEQRRQALLAPPADEDEDGEDGEAQRERDRRQPNKRRPTQ